MIKDSTNVDTNANEEASFSLDLLKKLQEVENYGFANRGEPSPIKPPVFSKIKFRTIKHLSILKLIPFLVKISMTRCKAVVTKTINTTSMKTRMKKISSNR